MVSKTNALERKLDELFLRSAPRLPRLGRKALVAWMPIISLIGTVLAVLAVWGGWRWSQTTGKFIGVCNAYSVSGCGNMTFSHSSVWLWVALILVATEGLLLLFAFPGLRDHRRDGWLYVEYTLLLNIVFAVVSLFADYAKYSHFFGGLFGSVLGFYLLFQIRSRYNHKKPARVHIPQVSEGSKQPAPFTSTNGTRR